MTNKSGKNKKPPKNPTYHIIQFLTSLYRTSPTELYAATVSLGWGLLLLAPQTSMQDTTAFAPFTVLLPEKAWAVLTFSLGLFGMISLGSGSLLLRHLSVLFSTAFYSFVGCAFVLRGYPFTAPIPYLCLAVFLFLDMLELARSRSA